MNLSTIPKDTSIPKPSLTWRYSMESGASLRMMMKAQSSYWQNPLRTLEPLRLVEVEDTRNSRPEKKISGTLCHNRWRREDKHA